MSQKYFIPLIIIIFFLVGEILLRVGFGFCNAVLVKPDNDFEYIAKENQERFQFGNNIIYNEFSMRSDNLDTSAIKILGVGDSVINGGVVIDQDDLVTSLLSNELSNRKGKKVQVLNISYKSWGPDNIYAYLNKYGDFNASAIFLVVSSHDAIDIMDFKTEVGKNINYPSSQYSLAYEEIILRHLQPRVKSLLKPKPIVAENYTKTEFNPGFQQLVNFCKEKSIPFLMYLHPELSELIAKKYNSHGQEIIAFSKMNNIKLVQGIRGADPTFYRDNIHLNEKGHQHILRALLPELESISK